MKIDNLNKTIERWAKDMAKKRSKIIDDFGKAYIVSRDDYDVKDLLKKGKLELVITNEADPRISTYQFRIKRGRPTKKNIEESHE